MPGRIKAHERSRNPVAICQKQFHSSSLTPVAVEFLNRVAHAIARHQRMGRSYRIQNTQGDLIQRWRGHPVAESRGRLAQCWHVLPRRVCHVQPESYDHLFCRGVLDQQAADFFRANDQIVRPPQPNLQHSHRAEAFPQGKPDLQGKPLPPRGWSGRRQHSGNPQPARPTRKCPPQAAPALSLSVRTHRAPSGQLTA